MKYKLAHTVIFAVLLLFTNFVQAAVWRDTQSWSPEMEERYEEWVKNSWNKNFFTRPGTPYTGLRSDCADTVYSMRIIFSYENRLPFKAVDPTGGSTLISNEMSRWDQTPDEDVKIRKFLSYIFEMMSTRTLPNETYPVAINRKTVRAGGLMLTTAGNHHSWTIKELMAYGVPHLVYNSTVGSNSGSILMERTSWPNPLWVFEGNSTPGGHAGIRDWRQLDDLKKPVWEARGYSDEQYKIPLNKWNATVERKLALFSEANEAKVKRLAETVCRGFQERVISVQEALEHKKQIGNTCLNEMDYDTFSTPSRDRRIFDDLMALRQAYRVVSSGLSEETRQMASRIFPHIGEAAASEAQKMRALNPSNLGYCTINIPGFQKMDLAEFKRRLFLGLVSNNPNDSLLKRWGTSDPSSRGGVCPNWGTWKPSFGAGN